MHLNPPLIEILLSTYNGEQYLPQLFDSILSQTYDNWRLLIRDDSSQDSTIEIINAYRRKYPDKFVMLEFLKKNVGHNRSFAVLLEAAGEEYTAFCDQDDVWLPQKLEIQMNQLLKQQNLVGKQTPVLVHSDLKVCDHKMNFISDSMWRYQKILPKKMKNIKCMLVQNCVTGCTILMNRALINITIPIPEQAIMYDWWTALLALEHGKIISIKEPLVMYRQHEKNAIGAKKWGFSYLVRTALGKKSKWMVTLHGTILQAAALERLLNNKDQEVIRRYSLLSKAGFIKRKIIYLHIGIKKYGLLRQIAAWFFI